MAKMIDIFGNGECILDKKNLPDEIIAVSGKWKKNEIKAGDKPSYSMVEQSQWYIDNVVALGIASKAEKKEKMDRDSQISQKMREMAIEALEKEKDK